MTVRELINQLRLYPDDAEIRVRPGDSSYAALVITGADGDKEVIGPPRPMGSYGAWGS